MAHRKVHSPLGNSDNTHGDDDAISVYIPNAEEAHGAEAETNEGYSCGPYGEAICDGRIVVFINGACKNNQQKAFRRGGVGCYWARGHPFNISELLEGEEQTNNRAELTAVMRVLQLEVQAVELRTDSKYVLDGVLNHRFQWRPSAWHGERRPVAKVDLWQQLDYLLESHPSGNVYFTKVKAHAKQGDMAAGLITGFDLTGYSAADMLAVAGACGRGPESLHKRRAWLRATAALSVQQMMVDILGARSERWRSGVGEWTSGNTGPDPDADPEVAEVCDAEESVRTDSDGSIDSDCADDCLLSADVAMMRCSQIAARRKTGTGTRLLRSREGDAP